MKLSPNIKNPQIALFCLLLCIGPGLGGYFVGTGIKNFKLHSNSVSVKGLASRVVDVDQATVTLKFKKEYNDTVTPQIIQAVEKEFKTFQLFVESAGIKIENPDESFDRNAYEKYRQNTESYEKKESYERSLRFITTDIETLKKLDKKWEEAQSAGQYLDFSLDKRLDFKNIEKIRPAMLAEATQSARAMADQFAKDSGTTTGSITRASQGGFEVLHVDATPYKRTVRVVSYISFSLN